MLRHGTSSLSVRESMVEGAACGAGRGEEPGIHSPWPMGGPNTVPTNHGAIVSTNHTGRCEAQNSQARSPRDWHKIAAANPFRPETLRNVGRPSGEFSLDPAIETDQKRNARATFPGTASSPSLVEGAGAYPRLKSARGFPVTSSGRQAQSVTVAVDGQSFFCGVTSRLRDAASCLSG